MLSDPDISRLRMSRTERRTHDTTERFRRWLDDGGNEAGLRVISTVLCLTTLVGALIYRLVVPA